MSCYHPMLGLPDRDAGLTETGKYRYKIEGSWHPEYKSMYPGAIKIPCGKCLGCRLDYSRRWADRMMLELESCNGVGCFLTLTYNNEHLPMNYIDFETGELFEDEKEGLISVPTLRKRDCQLFMKRLRKRFLDRSIRFYLAGEYGGKTFRPHYHVILFGVSLRDFPDRRIVGKNELGDVYFSSDTLERVWSDSVSSPIGFICLSDVSYKTCAYTARYVTKKIFGDTVPFGASPEFVLMSRRPGIGAYYLEQHPDCLDYSSIALTDSQGSVKVTLPHYFLDKLRLTDPVRYDTLVKERSVFANDRELLQLRNTDLSYLDYLDHQEQSFLNKTKILFNLREECI